MDLPCQGEEGEEEVQPLAGEAGVVAQHLLVAVEAGVEHLLVPGAVVEAVEAQHLVEVGAEEVLPLLAAVEGEEELEPLPEEAVVAAVAPHHWAHSQCSASSVHHPHFSTGEGSCADWEP